MRQLLAPLTPLALIGLQAPLLASPVNIPRRVNTVRRVNTMRFSSVSGEPDTLGADDDKKETVETRLLRILKERGVLTEGEFKELNDLGAQMRADDARSTAALEKEILDLSDSLSKRGQEMSKPASKPGNGLDVTYAFGKGVKFSNGQNFELNMDAFIQTRFGYYVLDDIATGGQDDRPSFDVRRLRFILEGFAGVKELEYKFQVDWTALGGGAGGSAALLRDAWLNYKVAPELQFRSGQMKRPFSRQQWIGIDKTQFIERSSVVERFRSVNGGDRDVGVMAWGETSHKLVEWYMGIYNGEGLNSGPVNAPNLGPASSFLNVGSQSNNDRGLEYIGKLVLNALGPTPYTEGDIDITNDPRLAFAAQADYVNETSGNTLALPAPAGVTPKYNVLTAGPEMAFKYSGFYLTSEAYWRSIDPYGTYADNAANPGYSTETGVFVQASYFLGSNPQEGFELMGRVSKINYDNSLAAATNAVGGTIDYSGGIAYYFIGHALKVQTGLTYRTIEFVTTSPDQHDWIVQIQMQLRL